MDEEFEALEFVRLWSQDVRQRCEQVCQLSKELNALSQEIRQRGDQRGQQIHEICQQSQTLHDLVTRWGTQYLGYCGDTCKKQPH